MTLPPDRRDAILQASLEAFLAQGYRATSLSDIRQRSGASTGSIYHFFAGKGALAEALFERAIHSWSTASGPAAADPQSSAKDAVRASVRGLVAWAIAHPDQARFLDEIRSLATENNELAGIARRLAEGQSAAASRYALWSARGEVRDLPWPVAHALMLGPAYDLIRRLPQPGVGASAAEHLAEAAWTAVRTA